MRSCRRTTGRSPCQGCTTAATQRLRWRRSSSPGCRARRLQPCSPSFAEPRVASSGAAKRGNVEVYDDYAHHPAEIAATLEALRDGGRRRSCSSSRISTPARDISHASSQPRLLHADVVAVTDVYRGTRGAGRRRQRQARRRCARRAATGDERRLDAVGRPGRDVSSQAWPGRRPCADDRRRRRRPRGDASPGERSREDRARTFRCHGSRRSAPVGRPARSRGRRRVEELQEALAYAGEHDLHGRGDRSRLEPARRRRGLRRAGAQARRGARRRRRSTGELLVAGGGAPNAVALHRARAAGLGGFEFACAIPGTAGGGVWMNAGAYGSDWAGDPRTRARRRRRRRRLADARRSSV